jgi:carboxylesterase type B
MNSGSIVPADPVDCPKGEVVYNTVVKAAGCASAASSLDCLRAADYTTFLNAANSVPGILGYTSVALSYVPRPDGVALTASPDVLVGAGKYAKIPVIIGDQEDEGVSFLRSKMLYQTDRCHRLFSLSSNRILQQQPALSSI